MRVSVPARFARNAVIRAAVVLGALASLALWTGASAQPGRSPNVVTPQSPNGPGANAPAGEREVAVVNRSKRVVNELYVSLSSADQWGDDRLGDDTLDPGKTYRVKLGRLRDCEFDVQVVYDDGSHEEARKVNVCRSKQYAFDGSTATAPPSKPASNAHSVTILNNAGRPIQQVFISSADANQWGDDRLGDDSLSTGDEKKLAYEGDCAADLRVVFDNRSAEERHGVNVCEQAAYEIKPGWTTSDTPPGGSGQSSPTRPSTPATITPSPASPIPAPAPPAAPAQVLATTDVSIVNQSGHDAAEVYVYPDGAADRGPDRLGADELKDGGTLVVKIERGQTCRFVAHVVYKGSGVADGDLHDIDLCASPKIVLTH